MQKNMTSKSSHNYGVKDKFGEGGVLTWGEGKKLLDLAWDTDFYYVNSFACIFSF